jgi:hypothetical protein
VLDFISPIISAISAGIRTTVNLAIDGINALIKAYNFANGLWGGADVALVSKLGENANAATTAQFSRSSSKINTTFPTGATTGSGAGTGAGSTMGTSIPTAAAASSAAATANVSQKALSNIDKLQKDVDKKLAAANAALDAANLASVKADAFLPPDPSILGRRDSGLTRTEGNIYNVTVNGAIDSESTARQLVTLLNDSQARGTLGASGLVGAVSF